MEERNQNALPPQEPKTWLTKARAAVNRAKLSRYLGFISVMVGTVVMSLSQVGWDPWKIGWQHFVANTALLVFLGVYGIFFGESEGGNLYKTMPTGLYQNAKLEFQDRVDEAMEDGFTDSLPDYIVWRYHQDYQAACKMKLMSVRMFDMSVLDLPREKIEELRHHPLKLGDRDEDYYSQLSEEQYQAVADVLDGKVFVDYIDDYQFYLNESDSDGEQQVTRVKNTPKRKEKITWKQRLSRVLMIIVVSLILGGFIAQAYEGDQGTAVRDLLSRISTIVVSVASGINTSRLLNMEDVFVLRYKGSYMALFIACMTNKTFVPEDRKAKAKAEFESYEEREKAARESVIEPEPVAPTINAPLLEGGRKDAE